ncbi:MAG: nucleotidyltransferase family protein, partial [Candidatus Aenigmatarchaeota archaeon]
MKAIILAGGHATRLWPVTKNLAKPLLPLAGKPIVSYILDELEGIDEIEKTYVSTNRKFEDSFKGYLSQRNGNVELVVEDQSSEEEKLGAVGAMMNVIQEKGDDDYIVIGGDNYYSLDLQDFLEYARDRNEVTVACFRLDDPEEARHYGVLETDGEGEIINFEEKPGEPRSDLVSTACYFFPEKRLDMFDRYVEYWEERGGEEFLDEPGRLIEWMSENYTCYAHPFEGTWMDIGTREGYLRAERTLTDGNLLKGDIDSTEIIGENVTVLEGSRVMDSKLENS